MSNAQQLLSRAMNVLTLEGCDWLAEEIREYLAESRPECVLLTKEELVTCWGMPYSLSTEELRRFARAVEKAALKKNQ